MKRYFVPILACVFLLTACGPRNVQFNVSPNIPAANAWAKVGSDQNENTTLEIQVRHLAPPENLTPARGAYVVWVQPRGETPINSGQLQVTGNLRGELKLTTPHRNFDLFVTAEDGPGVQQPQGMELMRTQISR